jgi:hypothetical protein
MSRHHAIKSAPIMQEAFKSWLREVSRESFSHTSKTYFTEEEMAEKHRMSTDMTREIIILNDQRKMIVDAFTKGNTDELVVTIPETFGVKKLTEHRDSLVREVHKGYKEETMTVYGIPNEDGMMYYFDVEGNEITERSRPLSIRDKREFIGLFMADDDEEPTIRIAGI